jgi:hypothetical protein
MNADAKRLSKACGRALSRILNQAGPYEVLDDMVRGEGECLLCGAEEGDAHAEDCIGCELEECARLCD